MDGTGNTFKPNMTTLALTYANAFSDKARFGISVKAITESIPRASASAFALDAGVQYENLNDIEGLGIGLVLKNIGTDMHYEGSGLTTTASDDDNLEDFIISSLLMISCLQLSIWQCLTRFLVLLLL